MSALANSLSRPSVDRGHGAGDRRRRSDWRVAALRCYEIGLSLQGAPEPPVSDPLSAEPATALLAETLTASVCHATNWDRLRRAVAHHARDGERFTPGRLATLDFATFCSELGDAFAPDADLRSRHRVFTETARTIAAGQALSLDALLHEPVRLGGNGGLYDRLRAVPAFAGDPEAKKARILVQELCRTRLIVPLDPEAVRPAIEYHLIRLYLRTERVLPQRGDDEVRLQEGQTFRAPIIMRIRRAVEEAMYFTAAAAELPIETLNHLEWQIARSFCDRRSPRCDGPPLPHKPCDTTITALAGSRGCPYSDVCLGAEDASGRTLRISEPRLSTRYDYY